MYSRYADYRNSQAIAYHQSKNRRNPMTQKTVQLKIPFESLVDAITSLGLEEKRKLWKLLEKDIAQAEADLLAEYPIREPSIQRNNGTNYKPTGEVLTIAEIRSRYPCEWVLIADTELDDQWNVIRGEVLAHSPERDEIDQSLIKFKHIQSISIEYTGPVPEDYAVVL